MDARTYLPSRQFILIAASLVLSIGLVFLADYTTKPHPIAQVGVDTNTSVSATNWEASLTAVQGTSDASTTDASNDQSNLDGLIQAAKSGNLTDAVSRGLLANLITMKSQGLGDDIPTQEKLVRTAVSQVDAVAPEKTYTVADLTLADNSSANLHAYGNATMDIFIKNSDQEFAKTLLIMNAATDGTGSDKLPLLGTIQKKYVLLATKLAATPVPKTLEPFHLELINDYAKMAATYDGMENIAGDPLGAFAALQQYRTISQDAGQMFINIAQALNKNDILFTTDEPGNTWSLLLQAQQ